MRIYSLCFELIYFISMIFLAIFAQFRLREFWLMRIFSRTKSRTRQEPSVSSFDETLEIYRPQCEVAWPFIHYPKLGNFSSIGCKVVTLATLL